MELPAADLVDKYTILLLKQQHGLEIADDELSTYRLAVMNLEWKELYAVNSLMWDLEDMISEEQDLARIGALYLALRGLTKRRVAAKNRIAEKCQQPREEKNY